MKNQTKNIIHSLLLSILFTVIIILAVVLLLKNLDLICKLLSDNELLNDVLSAQSKKNILIPAPIIFSVFVIYFAICYFIRKLNKLIFILLIITFSLVSLMSISMFSKLGEDFVFELIEKAVKYL